MARLTHELYKFVASFLPVEARQPDVVVAVTLVATGLFVAMLGAPIVAAVVAFAISNDSAGVAAVALFASGMMMSLAGMVVLTVSIFVDAFMRKKR